MKKIINEEEDLPFEINQTYTTKFQTSEKFTVKRIDTDKHGNPRTFHGIYEKHQHLGECPLNADRLIPYKRFTGKTIEMIKCPNCKELFKEE